LRRIAGLNYVFYPSSFLGVVQLSSLDTIMIEVFLSNEIINTQK
jgi:hypothetical protein